jgi:hypothetical protein
VAQSHKNDELAPRVGLEPTTNGLTGQGTRTLLDRTMRNRALKGGHSSENPVQYTQVRLDGKHLGNIAFREGLRSEPMAMTSV